MRMKYQTKAQKMENTLKKTLFYLSAAVLGIAIGMLFDYMNGGIEYTLK